MTDFTFTSDETADRRICCARASFLAGEASVDTALDDLQREGVEPRERAAALLARPMTPDRVLRYIGQEVTEEQITASLAQLHAHIQEQE